MSPLAVGFGSDDKIVLHFSPLDELCDRSLSAVDYLGLQNFDYIIVDKVPVLDENHHNEARRFITMVDACNETGTTLIIGSNAESLDKLFSSAFNPNDHGIRNRTNLTRMKTPTSRYGLTPKVAVVAVAVRQ